MRITEYKKYKIAEFTEDEIETTINSGYELPVAKFNIFNPKGKHIEATYNEKEAYEIIDALSQGLEYFKATKEDILKPTTEKDTIDPVVEKDIFERALADLEDIVPSFDGSIHNIPYVKELSFGYTEWYGRIDANTNEVIIAKVDELGSWTPDKKRECQSDNSYRLGARLRAERYHNSIPLSRALVYEMVRELLTEKDDSIRVKLTFNNNCEVANENIRNDKNKENRRAVIKASNQMVAYRFGEAT